MKILTEKDHKVVQVSAETVVVKGITLATMLQRIEDLENKLEKALREANKEKEAVKRFRQKRL